MCHKIVKHTLNTQQQMLQYSQENDVGVWGYMLKNIRIGRQEFIIFLTFLSLLFVYQEHMKD